MNYGKAELLINNSRELDMAGGIFTQNAFRKCSALSLTLRGEIADASRVNEAIKIIKNNTSVLSNFRGNNLFTTAVTISFYEDMEGSLREINIVYEKLKNLFFTNQYLILASIVIFNAKDRMNIDEAVKNTRVVYDYMKKNHRFLTGQEDISAAAMIAVTSTNIEEALKEIEEYYVALKYKGFWAGNNLQSLSHILPLFSGEVDEKVNKVVKIEEALRKNKVPLKNYSLPLLAIASVVAENPDDFAREVREVSEKIKLEKGFGSFSLGSLIRNMIAVGVVASDYVERLDDTDKEKLINTTNNVTLTIQIAIQIAAASAATAAAAASASS
ncbi:DUF4003 family protein [Clostridium paraputrificum]|uniref:DUF4003 family protein n=1 Tax=Clostridium TaxID=1485 RepID=UPI003D354EE3